jgi:hypothetical protein
MDSEEVLEGVSLTMMTVTRVTSMEAGTVVVSVAVTVETVGCSREIFEKGVSTGPGAKTAGQEMEIVVDVEVETK